MTQCREIPKVKGLQLTKQLEQAISLQQKGMLKEARRIYHSILDSCPQHADALHLSGVIAYQEKDFPASIRMIKEAIGVDSGQGIFYINLGNSFQAMGNLDAAIEAFETGLKLDASLSEGFFNLANAYQLLKRYDEALTNYDRFIDRNPEQAQAYFIKGEILRSTGRLLEAQKSFEQGLDFEPGNFMANFELAVIHDIQRHFDDAIHFYQQARLVQPRNPIVYNNLGNVYKEMGRFSNALEMYQAALDLDPFHKHALPSIFNLMCKRGYIKQAVAMLEAVLKMRPDWVPAHNLLGSHYFDQRNPTLSEKHLQKSIEADPRDATAYNLLGMLYSEFGRSTDARRMLCKGVKFGSSVAINNLGKDLNSEGRHQASIACIKKAIRKLPNNAVIHSNLIYFMHYSHKPRAEEIYKETQRWWNRHGANLPQYTDFDNDPSEDRPLRVGYISPDFRRHSVSYFFLPLVECHDRSKFRIICYSEVKKPDEVTDRIARLAEGWCSTVGLADDIVAEQIRKDRIDILVDLAGHTGNNRLLVLARRPAPVQVTWLGYPNTTGLPTIDYRVTDDIVDPLPGMDDLHSERLLRMPSGFLCFSPPQDAPDVEPLWNLKDQPVTFGSFNNLAKMNSQVISVWTAILERVPESKLILKSRVLGSQKIRERYLKLFERRGLDPNRISLLSMTPSIAEHIALYNQVAIGLDPMPYNGTTTTCEALYMGVPVVTLAGNRHSARVGASILTRVGLTDLIASTEEEYIKIAVELASNWTALAHRRDNLRDRLLTSDLCNAEQFTNQLEKQYLCMWTDWCQRRREGE